MIACQWLDLTSSRACENITRAEIAWNEKALDQRKKEKTTGFAIFEIFTQDFISVS